MDLDNYCTSGVYVITNEKESWAYVGYSTFILKAIAGVLKEYNTLWNLNDLNFNIVQGCSEEIEMRITATRKSRELKAQNYDLVRPENFGEYTIRKVMRLDRNKPVIDVFLVSRSNSKHLIGTWDWLDEANEWLDKKYPEGKVERYVRK